jgi:hypothetical protein
MSSSPRGFKKVHKAALHRRNRARNGRLCGETLRRGRSADSGAKIDVLLVVVREGEARLPLEARGRRRRACHFRA